MDSLMLKIGIVAAAFVAFLVLLALISLAVAFPVMLLWNWLMPTIFTLPEIGYWQAFGLLILTGILFRSCSSGSSSKS